MSTLGESVLKERPARAAELFDGALCDKAVWRLPGESTQEYITRRSKAFSDLKKVGEETSISNDLQARLLLKFCGSDKSDRASVVSNAGNKCDKEAFGKALRMQRPNIHERARKGRCDQRPDPRPQ